MKFTIKAGRKTSDHLLRMRFNSSRLLAFRFRVDTSCLYDDPAIIDAWNRVFGISVLGTHSSCDLVFIKDHLQFSLGMKVSYRSGCGDFGTSIIKRLGNICPGILHVCEIVYTKNDDGKWQYMLLIEGENKYHFIPASWKMDAPDNGLPVALLRHPKLNGRYTLDNDCHIEIELIK